MRLIVGLGNPGRKYEGTRHNMGYQVVAQLAQEWELRHKEKFHGEWYETVINEQKIGLLRPLTFMNLSGKSVSAAVKFYHLSLQNILVICDDFQLDLGRLRFRPGGSAGGQNGLQNLIDVLGTQEFPRLRIGIGPLPPGASSADFVLGRFGASELERARLVIQRAAQAVQDWIRDGTQSCMNKYNALKVGPTDATR